MSRGYLKFVEGNTPKFCGASNFGPAAVNGRSLITHLLTFVMNACLGQYWTPKTTEGFSCFGVAYLFNLPKRARARSPTRVMVIVPHNSACAFSSSINCGEEKQFPMHKNWTLILVFGTVQKSGSIHLV